MKLATSDFPKLQFGLLAMLAMIALGAAAIHYTNDGLKQAQTGLAAAQRERNEFDGKLRQVRSEEDEIRKKAAILDALETRGIIGAEQRLEWIELLKEIRDRRRIELHYELSPQRSLSNNSSGKLGLYASAMKLQLKLLHEGDLVNLINDLQQSASALIQVRYCNISRLPRSGTDASPAAQLQAECAIDWITLNSPEKP